MGGVIKLSEKCKICGGVVPKHRKYCSRPCYLVDKPNTIRKPRVKFTCKACGKIRWVLPSVVKLRTYCSKECADKEKMESFKGENNPSWKGGYYIGQNGYRYKRIDGKYVLEHKFVFEKHYGIKVPRGFLVHHKDKNKMNNSIENLEMMTYKQHSRFHIGKLSDSEYRKMKNLYATGKFTCRSLGKMFGINSGTVSRLLRRDQ